MGLLVYEFYHLDNGFDEVETLQGFTGTNESNLYMALMSCCVVQKVMDNFLGTGFADFKNAFFINMRVEMAVGTTKLAFARERNADAVNHD